MKEVSESRLRIIWRQGRFGKHAAIGVFLAFCCHIIHHVDSSSATSALPTKRLDLSYLHRTKTSDLAEAIRQYLLMGTDNNNQDNQDDVVEIDVSSSLIGKGQLQDILSSLQEGGGGVNPKKIRLAARWNHWTPNEGATLFQSILAGPEPEENDEKNSASVLDKVSNDDNTIEGGDDSGNVTKIDPSSSSSGNKTKTTSESTVDNQDISGSPLIVSLDLGWNNFCPEQHAKSSTKSFLKALQNLVADPVKCPNVLRLDVCGLGPGACRALGKGIMARHEEKDKQIKPFSLHLTRNEAIGDAGIAALSAAIRMITSKKNEDDDDDVVVFDELDLSGCGIGDTGAEALAIALKNHPFCIRRLDLSSNQITDDGAAALARVFSSPSTPAGKAVEMLDLSNNKDLGDSGAKALALAFEKGSITQLILRSCHIHADGAACFAKALKAIGKAPVEGRPVRLWLDMSGNPLGILRKKAKTGGGKYSATALRSKATATTSAYMNLIGKTVQKGLKDLGISEGSGSTLESDDEEESPGDGENDEDPSKVKCGALAFADEFIADSNDDNSDDNNELSDSGLSVEVALRHCAFDTRAAEALAAIRQEAKSRLSIDLMFDVRMNNVLEEDTIAALQGDGNMEEELSEMAERYLEAMDTIRVARQRAMEASRAASARMRAEADMHEAWGAPAEMDDFDAGGGYDEQWDSDADYDADVDEDDFF